MTAQAIGLALAAALALALVVGGLWWLRYEGKLIAGLGDLFPDLAWDNRPDMSGSGAPQELCAVWTAVMLATRDKLGGITPGSCFVTALAAAPVIAASFDRTAVPCAGYAGFVDNRGRAEWGFRWRPAKWVDWVDASTGAHLPPWSDVHTWVETETHVVDLSTDREGKPLLYRPKWRMPKHPRDARLLAPGERTILLWRNSEALQIVREHVGTMVPPITARALQILAEHRGSGERIEPTLSTRPVPGARTGRSEPSFGP